MLIRAFGKERAEEEKPSSPLEETCTSAVTTLEEQPSTSTVKGAITLEEVVLVALQIIPKSDQVMNEFPLYIITENHSEGSGNQSLHDQGSTHIANLE